jgi:hypothetical protein
MLTLFTVAKPFRGEFAVIQRNAILSWTRLRPHCEILLLGDEEGIAEIASETGAVHVPVIERNEFGTPLVNGIFSEAQKRASFPLLCYVNADIILLSDFLPAIRRATEWNPKSLVVGGRRDLNLLNSLLWQPNWEDQLRALLGKTGALHPHSGLDYFVFPRNLLGQLPAFAIGRCLWDGWLLYRARSLGVPVVDATEQITAVHQNHGYSHHLDGEFGVWEGTEKQHNLLIGGGLRNGYTLRDATHRLTKLGVRRRWFPINFHRAFILPITTSAWGKPLVRAFKPLGQGARRLRRERCHEA